MNMPEPSTPSGSRSAASPRDWAPHIRSRLSSLRLSPARENEIVEEISQHLDDRWRELTAGGVPEDEAMRTALASFTDMQALAKSLGQLRQAHMPAPIAPGASAGRSFLGLWRDMRYAVRTLTRQPAFSLAAILTLALGIGATTAVFSVVENVLLSPLPYPDEGRIVRVQPTVRASRNPVGDRGRSFSPRGYWHFVNNNRSFEKLGAYRVLDNAVPITGDDPALLVNPALMTLSAFQVLGVSPQRGRLPTPQEDAPGGSAVALLGHDLWVTQFGSDPSVVGKTISVSGVPREVIGVMPPGYDFPTPRIDVWLPYQLNPASTNFTAHNLSAIGRLKAGTTIDAAIADSRGLIARFGEAGYDTTWLTDVFDGDAIVRPLREEIVGDVRRPLLIALGTVGLVLLVACSNIANLLLVRADGRRQEYAVRIALGASRARLARGMLAESLALALAGGVAGVLLAYGGTRALVLLQPVGVPRLGEVGIDASSLAFTMLVAIATGLLFGVVPAVRLGATRSGVLRDGGRGVTKGGDRHRTRNALVMAEVALAFVLVAGAGLMVRTFAALRSVDPGFSPGGVLTFEVWPLPTKYRQPQAAAQFHDQLIERLEAIPGVIRAGAVDALPLTGDDDEFAAVMEGAESEPIPQLPTFKFRRVLPGYFDAMGMRLVEGRTFTRDDFDPAVSPVLISESVKSRYWPRASALGKRVTFGRSVSQIVGVIRDVHDAGLNVAPDSFLYFPMRGVGQTTVTLRTAVEPLSLVNLIRRELAGLDRDLPMGKVQTMDRVVASSIGRTSFTMSVLVIAAAIAVLLGAIGIYGVLSYVVSQRTQEIGIRVVMGASPGAMRRMVLSQGMRLTGVGALIGLVAALVLGRIMVALLYGVSPVDPVTLVGASAIFLAVAGLASLLPAARAAGTDPVDALRAS